MTQESKNFMSREMSPAGLKITILILFILVFVSLGLNGYLIWELLTVRRQATELVQEFKPAVQQAISQADTELAAFQESTIEFDLEISQVVPVEAEIPIHETIEVPIQLTVPIKEQIQTTIMIDPLQAGLEIPVDIDVPIEVEVPIDMVVPFTIDRTVNITTSVPLELDFPIVIEMDQTDLTDYVERLRAGLAASQQFIERITADIEEP